MKSFIVFLIIPFFCLLSNDDMQKEYEMRFGNKGKKGQFGSTSQKKPADIFFKMPKGGKSKKRMSVKGSVPNSPTDNDNSSKDTLLSELNGKYEVTSEGEGYKDVKFLESVTIKKAGLTFQIESPDQSANFHASFEKNGTLGSNYVDLANSIPVKVGNYDLEISNWVSFNDNGKVNFLCPAVNFGDSKKLQIGNYTITYHSSTSKGELQKIFFYESGTVQSIHIKTPHTLQVGSQSYTFQHHEGCGGDLDFFESGKLQGGYLGKPATVNGIEVPKGGHVAFYEDGQIETISFKKLNKVQNYPIVSSDEYWPHVQFHPNGKVKTINALGKAMVIDGKKFKKKEILEFDEEGNIDKQE